MTVDPLLIEYEARLHALHAGWTQLRIRHAAAATALIVAAALVLTLGFFAVRQRIPLGVTRETNALAIARMAGVPV